MNIQEKMNKFGFLFQDTTKYEKNHVSIEMLDIVSDCLQRLRAVPCDVVPNEQGIAVLFTDACHTRYAELNLLDTGAIVATVIFGIKDTDHYIWHVAGLTEIPHTMNYIDKFIMGDI